MVPCRRGALNVSVAPCGKTDREKSVAAASQTDKRMEVDTETLEEFLLAAGCRPEVVAAVRPELPLGAQGVPLAVCMAERL